MKLKNRQGRVQIGIIGIMLLLTACGLSSNLDTTPTPTPFSGGAPEVKSPETNRCEALSGELEMQVLVGPSEAVGLEPYAVGEIPFSVVSEGGSYVVRGGGAISYQDVLQEEWGTFTVSLDMEATLDGECEGTSGSEVLNLTIEMSGEQMVEVRAEGFQGDYPWSGTHELTFSFSLEDGATAEGEGWVFVLHLND